VSLVGPFPILLCIALYCCDYAGVGVSLATAYFVSWKLFIYRETIDFKSNLSVLLFC
jgi:hypothetical protein